jgi:serine/threonine protein kinase
MLSGTTQLGSQIDLPRKLGKFCVESQIGAGTTCVVLKAREKGTDRVVALKVMNEKECERRNILRPLHREINIVRQLSHPNIVRFLDVFRVGQLLVVAMEYCPDNLLSCTMKKRLNSAASANRIFAQVVSAIQYCHNLGIAHGDIKLDNILIDRFGNAKLSDFGYCKTEQTVGDDQKGGTLLYAAPELLRNGSYEPQRSDVWSLGIMFYVMHSGTFPWRAANKKELRELIARGALLYRDVRDLRVRRLIAAMTKVAPRERIAVADILADPIFGDVRAELTHETLDPFAEQTKPVAVVTAA